MEIYNNISEVSLHETAVALGYFDGLHLGHRKVINKAVSLKNKGLSPTVLTFLQNPKSVASKNEPLRIMDTQKKKNELQKMGIEALYILNFLEIKNLEPEEFVREILFKKLNAKATVCGFNYHFGHGGKAGAEDLKIISKKYGIKTYIIKPVLYKKEIISSSKIRDALVKKDFKKANSMLGINTGKYVSIDTAFN